jgi:hypothetical protein
MSQDTVGEDLVAPKQKILTLLSGGLLLVLGFLAGWYGQNTKIQSPLQVTVVQSEVNEASGTADQSEKREIAEEVTRNENCPFVGSKNSNKYHSVDSSNAARIKPENKRCFASEEVAKESGYTKASGS